MKKNKEEQRIEMVKRKNRIVVVGCCIVLAAAISLMWWNSAAPHGGLGTGHPGIERYHNDQFGFEFWYPEGWQWQENAYKNPLSQFNVVGASPQDGGQPNPLAPSIEVNFVTPSFANNIDTNLKKLGAKTSDVTVGGASATRFDYASDKDEKIALDVSHGKERVLISAEKKYEKELDEIVSTFTFLKK